MLTHILIASFSLLATYCLGQNQPSGTPERETTLHPATPQAPSKKELRKMSSPKTTVDLQREYYARVEQVLKARRKMEKQMQKPQYSDPMYFGHKKKPKKRSPKKMRFCHECGIRH